MNSKNDLYNMSYYMRPIYKKPIIKHQNFYMNSIKQGILLRR